MKLLRSSTKPSQALTKIRPAFSTRARTIRSDIADRRSTWRRGSTARRPTAPAHCRSSARRSSRRPVRRRVLPISRIGIRPDRRDARAAVRAQRRPRVFRHRSDRRRFCGLRRLRGCAAVCGVTAGAGLGCAGLGAAGFCGAGLLHRSRIACRSCRPTSMTMACGFSAAIKFARDLRPFGLAALLVADQAGIGLVLAQDADFRGLGERLFETDRPAIRPSNRRAPGCGSSAALPAALAAGALTCSCSVGDARAILRLLARRRRKTGRRTGRTAPRRPGDTDCRSSKPCRADDLRPEKLAAA